MTKFFFAKSIVSAILATISSISIAQEAKHPPVELTVEKPTLKKKAPYSAIGIFGADTTFGAPDRWVVPIARVIGYKEFNKLDILAQADTLGISLQADYRTNPGIGIKPYYNYIAHGDYRHFNETGNRLRSQEVKGSMAGLDFFTTYIHDKFTGKATLGNGYKWYGAQSETTITPPASHSIHDLAFDFSYLDSKTKELVIKEGLEATLHLAVQRRGASEMTTRMFAFAGYYYNSSQDYNLKVEARAGIESGSDLQNAWYLGSFISRQAPLPGRGYMQFRQSSFFQAQASLGIPVIDSIRAEPSIGTVMFPL